MKYPDVRRAQSEDQGALAELWTRLLDEQADLDDRIGVAEDAQERWENDFPLWLDEETSRIFVAEVEGTLVGFAAARRWGPAPIYEESSEVYLDDLYVRPDHRRTGVGTQLVNAVRDWSDRIGARRVRLRVLTANADARAFWAAQEGIPLSMTLTIEGKEQKETPSDEGSKKIGF